MLRCVSVYATRVADKNAPSTASSKVELMLCDLSSLSEDERHLHQSHRGGGDRQDDEGDVMHGVSGLTLHIKQITLQGDPGIAACLGVTRVQVTPAWPDDSRRDPYPSVRWGTKQATVVESSIPTATEPNVLFGIDESLSAQWSVRMRGTDAPGL